MSYKEINTDIKNIQLNKTEEINKLNIIKQEYFNKLKNNTIKQKCFNKLVLNKYVNIYGC